MITLGIIKTALQKGVAVKDNQGDSLVLDSQLRVCYRGRGEVGAEDLLEYFPYYFDGVEYEEWNELHTLEVDPLVRELSPGSFMLNFRSERECNVAKLILGDHGFSRNPGRGSQSIHVRYDMTYKTFAAPVVGAKALDFCDDFTEFCERCRAIANASWPRVGDKYWTIGLSSDKTRFVPKGAVVKTHDKYEAMRNSSLVFRTEGEAQSAAAKANIALTPQRSDYTQSSVLPTEGIVSRT